MATSVRRQENKVLWDVNLTRGIQKLVRFYKKRNFVFCEVGPTFRKESIFELKVIRKMSIKSCSHLSCVNVKLFFGHKVDCAANSNILF